MNNFYQYSFNKKDIQTIGKYFTRGVIDSITTFLLIILTIFLIGALILNFTSPKDNTDPVSGRSGLRLYTDHLTGVQYVEGRNGLAVRVDRDGKPVIVPPDKE